MNNDAEQKPKWDTSQMITAETNLGTLQSEIAELRAENIELKEANRDCRKTISERGMCIDIHQLEIAKLRANLVAGEESSLQASIVMKREIDKLRTKKNALLKSYFQKEAKVEELEAEVAKLTAATAQMEKMAETLTFYASKRHPVYQTDAHEALAQYEQFKEIK